MHLAIRKARFFLITETRDCYVLPFQTTIVPTHACKERYLLCTPYSDAVIGIGMHILVPKRENASAEGGDENSI